MYTSLAMVAMLLLCLSQLIEHWEGQRLELSKLEEVLVKEIATLSFPFSLIIRE